MGSFVKKIQNFAFHNKLFFRGEKILIGISGGPDSICLSRVFLKLQKHFDLELVLLHVNYGLRGKESEKDEEFVREFAKENGLQLKVVQFEKNNSKEKKENLEAKMRAFRYAQFEQFAKDEGFARIALAHNADDQVETFLMNLFRGSGTKGLSAMKSKRGKIIRPMLFVSKKEILVYLKEVGQKYRIDESNFDESFLRNKIRHSLISTLEKYSPQLRDRILQLTANLGDENEVVEEIVEKKYNEIVQNNEGKYLVLTSKLVKCSLGMRKLLFRRILKNIKGELKNVSNNNFFEFNKILESEKSKSQHCGMNGVRIERRGEEISFQLE
jgi:tRNA(Ile)-lysidine synthase